MRKLCSARHLKSCNKLNRPALSAKGGTSQKKAICIIQLGSIDILSQPKYKTINFPNLGSLNKKFVSHLADFGWLGVGAWVNLLKNENLWRKPFF